MKITELSLYKIVFVVEILFLMFIFSKNLTKKKNYYLKLIISNIIIIAISIFFPTNLLNNKAYTWWYSSLMFLILFCLCVSSLFLLYETSWKRIFLISIVCYTTQHFSHELYAFLGHALNIIDSSYLGAYGS